MRLPRNIKAALLLFFFPCFSVELLSGNTPLLVILINPIGYMLMNLMYGGAALLIRETVIRWNKGLVSVLLFGLAYGMVNEGIGSKGFFDPNFYALVGWGLENFGRVFGINVPWALGISVFHMVFSITVPIMIVNALFPERERWLNDKAFFTLLAVFLVGAVFFSQLFNGPYIPDTRAYVLVITLILLLVMAARFCPEFPDLKRINFTNTALLNGLPFLCGLVAALASFTIPAAVRHLVPFPVFYIISLAGVEFLFVLVFWRFLQMPPRSRIALAAGVLTPMIMMALTSGKPIVFVALVLIVFLIMAWRKSSTEFAKI